MMAFVIDMINKKLKLTFEQDIDFVDILDSYVWQKYRCDLEEVEIPEADKLDIITRVARSYMDLMGFEIDIQDVDEAVLDVIYKEEHAKDCKTKITKKDKSPIIDVPAEDNPGAEPAVETVPDEPIELEEPATPEDVKEIKDV